MSNEQPVIRGSISSITEYEHHIFIFGEYVDTAYGDLSYARAMLDDIISRVEFVDVPETK